MAVTFGLPDAAGGWQAATRPAADDRASSQPAEGGRATSADWPIIRGNREQTGVAITFDADPARFPKPVETALYRIIHEAVHNVIKHAQAGQVLVRVKQDRQHLVVEVQDNGVGFDPAALEQPGRRKGVGLLSMRKRAELLQGSFALTSSPGTGTRVRVQVPLLAPEADSPHGARPETAYAV